VVPQAEKDAAALALAPLHSVGKPSCLGQCALGAGNKTDRDEHIGGEDAENYEDVAGGAGTGRHDNVPGGTHISLEE